MKYLIGATSESDLGSIIDALLHPFARQMLLSKTLYIYANRPGLSISFLVENLAKKIV